MNHRHFVGFVSVVAGLAAVGGEMSAAQEGVVSHRMPELRVDPSPVSSGRSAVVASYADVLEPVQQAVVSIFSTKLVR